jgi:hypothetical protein
MISKKNLLRGLRNPRLGLVLIRRWFPWDARYDLEHDTWSAFGAVISGAAYRSRIFTGVQASRVVVSSRCQLVPRSIRTRTCLARLRMPKLKPKT